MRARRKRLPKMVLLDRAELAPGDSALAQLRLDDEILLLPGDRFILRQFSPVVTIGGGIVVDARPPRHQRNDPAVGNFLERIERGNAEQVLAAIAEAAPRGLTLEDMVARTGWLEADVRAAVKKLVEQKKLRILTEQPLTVAPEAALTKSASAILEAVDRFHRDNPLLPGIPKQELRGRVGKPRMELFEAALGDLVEAAARWASRAISCSAPDARSRFRRMRRARRK